MVPPFVQKVFVIQVELENHQLMSVLNSSQSLFLYFYFLFLCFILVYHSIMFHFVLVSRVHFKVVNERISYNHLILSYEIHIFIIAIQT